MQPSERQWSYIVGLLTTALEKSLEKDREGGVKSIFRNYAKHIHESTTEDDLQRTMQAFYHCLHAANLLEKFLRSTPPEILLENKDRILQHIVLFIQQEKI
jgi:hypothetical protein